MTRSNFNWHRVLKHFYLLVCSPVYLSFIRIIKVAKTKMLISCKVTAQLIWIFVFIIRCEF